MTPVVPSPSHLTPSSSALPLPATFFSSFFSLPADSEFWLTPAVFGDMVIQDHHFRVPRDRSQHRLLFLFVAFTKRGCFELLIFSPAKLQIFLCLPIRHFPKRIQENPRVSIADLVKDRTWGTDILGKQEQLWRSQATEARVQASRDPSS